MGKLNLSPADLTFIINSIDRMKTELERAAQVLKTDTGHIQSKWDDDQFVVFKETMVVFHKNITVMAEQLENEKNRVQRLQSDANATAVQFNKDFR